MIKQAIEYIKKNAREMGARFRDSLLGPTLFAEEDGRFRNHDPDSVFRGDDDESNENEWRYSGARGSGKRRRLQTKRNRNNKKTKRKIIKKNKKTRKQKNKKTRKQRKQRK
jgi:hypothetical protein